MRPRGSAGDGSAGDRSARQPGQRSTRRSGERSARERTARQPGQRPAGQAGERPERAAAGRGLATLREQLRSVIDPVVSDAGFDLEQVRVSRVGRRHRVQVVVDHDDGVGLDAVAEVSRAVSGALDDAEQAGVAVMPGEYVLEVSSPGVDRPLTEPRHWRRNLGRLVSVTGPQGTLTGRVRQVTAEAVVLEVDGVAHELPYAQLGPGRVQVELRAVDADGEGDGE